MWIHFYGYLVGSSMVVLGFDELGLTGLIRKAEIFPLSHTFIPAELAASIGAVIADVATVVWLVNLLLTLVRGRTANIESLTDSYTLITMHTASNLPNHVFKWNNHNIK